MKPNHTLIEAIEKRQVRERPDFRAGDTIAVHFRIREGEKERVQVFQGVCIGINRGAHRATITVRKMSFSQGVERIFPLSSPRVEKIDVIQRGRVRRAKLFYLRKLRGKKARISERMDYTRRPKKT